MKIIFFLLITITLFAKTYTLDFQGNKTFSKEELYKALGFEQKFWQKILFKKFEPKVDEKLFPLLYDELEGFYRAQGFWDVEIDLHLKDQKAIFSIRENEPIRIKALSVTSDFPLEVPFTKNERFNAREFTAFKQKVQKNLLEKGYCSYDFRPKAYIYHKTRSAYLSFFLNKGLPCKIASITIHGLKTVPKEVVLSHISLKPKSSFSLEKVDRSYKKLYSLGYFQTVRIDYERKVHNNILLDIYLKEKQNTNIYKAGIGYESDQGFLIDLFYKNSNFHTLQPSFQFKSSLLQKKLSLKLFIPSIKIKNNFYNTNIQLLYSLDRFKTFRQKTKEIGIEFLHESFWFSYKAGLKAQKASIFQSNSCIQKGDFRLLYPFFDALLDRRDSKNFPTSGFLAHFYVESSIKALSSSDYIKIILNGAYYFQLSKALFVLKGRYGNITSSAPLPPASYFIAGGPTSNRAFASRSLYALDSSCKEGGTFLLEHSIELRYPIKNFYAALFWDRTYLQKSHFPIRYYKDGIGVGVLYPTPIGTLRAYIGIEPGHISQHAINIFFGASF